MKGQSKAIFIITILSAVLLLIFSGISFSGVTGTSHDLVGGGTFTFDDPAVDNVCFPCHTPHHAVVTDGTYRLPLWNRSIAGLAASTFTAYSNPGSLNSSPETSPRGTNLLCLSCHDGVTALNAVINDWGYADISMDNGYNQLGDLYFPLFPVDNPSSIGDAYTDGRENIKDLSDDHPVGFVYDTNLVNADGALNSPSSISPLRLFNDRLECATCHDPHDNQYTYFLRMDNSSSQMCTTCHIK